MATKTLHKIVLVFICSLVETVRMFTFNCLLIILKFNNSVQNNTITARRSYKIVFVCSLEFIFSFIHVCKQWCDVNNSVTDRRRNYRSTKLNQYPLVLKGQNLSKLSMSN